MESERCRAQNMEYVLRHRLLVSNYDQWHAIVSRKLKSDEPLKVTEIDGGIILPPVPISNYKLGGVFDRDMKFVGGFYRLEPPNRRDGMAGAYEFKDADELDEEVIFGGAAFGHFGHFILDSFSRLWYLAQNPDDKRRVAFVDIWVGASAWRTSSWMKKFFGYLGLTPDRVMFVEKPTRFKKIVVPDESIHAYYGYSDGYISSYDRMIRNLPTPPRAIIHEWRKFFYLAARCRGAIGLTCSTRSTSQNSSRARDIG